MVVKSQSTLDKAAQWGDNDDENDHRDNHRRVMYIRGKGDNFEFLPGTRSITKSPTFREPGRHACVAASS